MHTISVITPSYNQGKFIERTICSVIDQNITDMEYVVYDGGSTDETLSILQKYQNSIRWVSEPDNGQAHAVNKGISTTSGDIIAWINSDDIYFPGALKEVLHFFSKNPQIDVVYGDAFHIDERDQIINAYNTEPWDITRLKDVCYLCQPAVFFRRSLVNKYGYLDSNLHFSMDYEYWLRLAMSGVAFAYLQIPLAGSRLYAENKTLSQTVSIHKEINDMLKEKLEKVPDSWLFNYAHRVVDKRGVLRNTFTYSVLVSIESLLASLHWNHSISKNMFRTIIKWTASIRNR